MSGILDKRAHELLRREHEYADLLFSLGRSDEAEAVLAEVDELRRLDFEVRQCKLRRAGIVRGPGERRPRTERGAEHPSLSGVVR